MARSESSAKPNDDQPVIPAIGEGEVVIGMTLTQQKGLCEARLQHTVVGRQGGSTPPLSYSEFRTGYTFADVYHMIWNRKHKRRNGVLGFWRELKLRMYAEYLHGFEDTSTYTPSEEPIQW